MKVCFDGLRKSIARTYNKVAFDFLENKEELRESIEELRMHVGTLIALESDDSEDSFKALDIVLYNVMEDGGDE